MKLSCLGAIGHLTKGCGTMLHVPKLSDGLDSPVFQCVWCMAICHTHPPRSSRFFSRRSWCNNLEHMATRWGGRFLLLVVSALILSIALSAFDSLVPVLCGDSWLLYGRALYLGSLALAPPPPPFPLSVLNLSTTMERGTKYNSSGSCSSQLSLSTLEREVTRVITWSGRYRAA